MSRMSDISLEIQDRLVDGQEPKIIAMVMEIPITWVYAEVESMESLEPEIDYTDL